MPLTHLPEPSMQLSKSTMLSSSYTDALTHNYSMRQQLV